MLLFPVTVSENPNASQTLSDLELSTNHYVEPKTKITPCFSFSPHLNLLSIVCGKQKPERLSISDSGKFTLDGLCNTTNSTSLVGTFPFCQTQ
jgi:hypothetical protein